MNNDILNNDISEFVEQFELSEAFRNKKFLITGSTGLIGSVLIKCLLSLNHHYDLNCHIIAPVRNLLKAKIVFDDIFNYIEFVECEDISTFSYFTKVDYIIHLATPTASKYFTEFPVETLNTTFCGTLRLLEIARNIGVESFVYVSSLEVYGTNMDDKLLSEEYQGYVNPTEVRSSYNMGKRASECLCHSYSKEYGVPVKIARLTQTFGAGVEYNDNRVFAQFARKVIEGKDIELQTKGETARMYCYTTDAVSALLYLLVKGINGEAYNVANKKTYISIINMALMLKAEFNKTIEVAFVKGDDNCYAPPTKLKLDTSKIERLGWEAKVDMRQMFERLICYMRHNKALSYN